MVNAKLLVPTLGVFGALPDAPAPAVPFFPAAVPPLAPVLPPTGFGKGGAPAETVVLLLFFSLASAQELAWGSFPLLPLSRPRGVAGVPGPGDDEDDPCDGEGLLLLLRPAAFPFPFSFAAAGDFFADAAVATFIFLLMLPLWSAARAGVFLLFLPAEEEGAAAAVAGCWEGVLARFLALIGVSKTSLSSPVAPSSSSSCTCTITTGARYTNVELPCMYEMNMF